MNQPLAIRPGDGTGRRPGTGLNGARVVGVAGGGQLARMMAPAARALGLELVVMDPDPHCAAAEVADVFLAGDFAEPRDLARLAERADVVTFEIERVSAEGLRRLEADGRRVAPSANVLGLVQDKLAQKEFLHSVGIPVPAFRAFDRERDAHVPEPFVWKARYGGYDGRGVVVVRDAGTALALPATSGLTEALVDIERELAIVVARGHRGEVVLYPLTEILMDPDEHVLDTVVAPAVVDSRMEHTCRTLAREIADRLDYVGVFAIEFFVNTAGEVLVNEISPRPHNSGHYTIEACITSQFEQHLRAVAGLDLGPTDMQGAAATLNVLGRRPSPGQSCAPDFRALSGRDGVVVHDYGKAEPRPGRKLGHVTVVGETPQDVLDRVRVIKPELDG